MAIKIIMAALAFVFVMILLIMGFASHISPMFRFIVPGILLGCTALLMAACYLYGLDAGKKKRKREVKVKVKNKEQEEGESKESPGMVSILAELPSEYVVVHNFESLDVNVDHIVIGPTGIFVIMVKDLRGGVERIGDALLLNHRRSLADYLAVAKDKADYLRAVFKLFGGSKKVIKPVLCFTQAYVNLLSRGEFDGVQVTSAKDLVAFITESTETLDSFDVYRAYTFLSDDVDVWYPKLLETR